MKRYHVRLTAEAEADVAWIYRFVRRKSASSEVARNYVGRIRTFLKEFETFPERGTVRDIRDGMRIVGSSGVSASPSSWRTAKSWSCASFMPGSSSAPMTTVPNQTDGRSGKIIRTVRRLPRPTCGKSR
ncbi:type II toxin-antitoxin system RelE/ParE family toxin [Neorhizobium vignae]|uniref:type II toxin-antitoxin system RelE/ParE family toxin n=1 Tax=Neorhizobium vignae TaxID=690585 RepID=UPI001FCAD28F|nr:hypothetical protein [Neorhizobium vignae]